MNSGEVYRITETYLNYTQCTILEKSDVHVLVKLSEEADRALTNRHFYWGFVDRTSAPAETMTFVFVFDRQKYIHFCESKRHHALTTTPYRVEHLYWGGQMFERIVQAIQQRGQVVNLFEAYSHGQPVSLHTFLVVHCKIRFCCDRQREQLQSLAISLCSGHIVNPFASLMDHIPWSTQLPAYTSLEAHHISLNEALARLEKQIRGIVSATDAQWAQEAKHRMQEELAVMNHYYEPLLADVEEDEERAAITQQYLARQKEIEAQYAPRIEVSVINGGLFHLSEQTFQQQMAESCIAD